MFESNNLKNPKKQNRKTRVTSILQMLNSHTLEQDLNLRGNATITELNGVWGGGVFFQQRTSQRTLEMN